MSAGYIRYIHNNPSINTVQDLLKDKFSPFYNMKESDFLNIIGDNGLTNKESILNSYSELDENEKYPLLKLGTTLYIEENEDVLTFLSVNSQNQVEFYDSHAIYIDEYLKKLYSNPKYKPTIKYPSSRGNSVEYINSMISVWIYSKANNEIVDISSLCTNLSINVNGNENDNFSLQFHSFDERDKNIDALYHSDHLKDFSNRLSENDIVFIRFEELDIDRDKQDRSNRYTIVDKNKLAGNFFDFIGLATVIKSDIDYSTDSCVTSIAGQSLAKLLVEDECIFIPQAIVADSATGSLLIGSQTNDSLIKRLYSDGSYNFLFAKSHRTLGDSLKFIINQLSNIGIVRDESLFSSYGDRISKKWKIKNGEDLSAENCKGVYQIVKLSIDSELEKLCLVDSTISNPSGNICSLFRKICQNPFVEMVMDTYGDVFNLFVRRPPFTKKAIKEYTQLNLKQIKKTDVLEQSFIWENNFFTWFEIEPKGYFLGMANATALARVPILYLPEYVNLWGSKPLRIEDNYVPEGMFIGDELQKKQIIADLAFVVESHIYLPFTRKGTIVLNKGDRTIKKGTWISYEATGEIFYVDSVSNSFSINNNTISRTTTLRVSRGMVKKHIDKYFEIFDLEAFKNSLKEYLISAKKQGISRDIYINKENLDFFLNKKQFD